MLEKLKKASDNGLCTGILLTDLSKAFDCISRNAKNALRLINDYLSKRKQRTKVGESFSTWRELIYGVPQGSILGPLLFNIYINDLFLFSEDFPIANYADDCSPYELRPSIDHVIVKLQENSKLLINWYESNYLKPNPGKWHLLLSEIGDEYFVNIGSKCIFNSKEEKILGVYFDNKLNFKCHLRKLCKRSSIKLHALARISNFMSLKQRKLHALARISNFMSLKQRKLHALVRISNFMSLKQRKIIMNSFVSSQFNYCPLLWMCHCRTLHTQINKIHERALRIVYKDEDLSFGELLEKSGSVSIHYRNLQLLAVEFLRL